MVNYIGNIHGDETVGRQLILYLAQYLLHNYGTDSRITKLVDDTEIFLMPSSNPDGFTVALPEQGKIFNIFQTFFMEKFLAEDICFYDWNSGRNSWSILMPPAFSIKKYEM